MNELTSENTKTLKIFIVSFKNQLTAVGQILKHCLTKTEAQRT